MITTILFYGYCVGVFSSRRIQKRVVPKPLAEKSAGAPKTVPALPTGAAHKPRTVTVALNLQPIRARSLARTSPNSTADIIPLRLARLFRQSRLLT